MGDTPVSQIMRPEGNVNQVLQPDTELEIANSFMKLNATCSLALLAAAGALFLTTTAVQASDTDDRIVASAKNSYVFKTYLKHDKIKTHSKDGVVTLTGTVEESGHKSLAQDTVEGLPGVHSVDNQIRIASDEPAEHSDTWIGTKIKFALLFHRNVSATGTEVQVKEGFVTLRGEASSMAQKELTTEYARDIENVKGVKNEMTIASVPTKPEESLGDKIDDASITAQVKASLLAHRSTSVLKTKVETTDGVVTVSGVAKNAAEKSLVTKLISDIYGVSGVVNNMIIALPVAGA